MVFQITAVKVEIIKLHLINEVGTTGQPFGKKKLDQYFTSYTSITSKWITEMNVKRI